MGARRTVIEIMTMITGIANIDRRISVIESKIAVRRGTSTNGSEPASTSLDVAGPADPTVGFDAFGAAYLQAVQASSLSADGPSNPAAPSNGALRVDSGGGFAVRSAGRSYISLGTSVGQVGGYGDMPVPAELASYGNGRIPATALEPIGQGHHRLYGPAAEAWKSAVAAARADDVDLRVTDSYRSHDQQVTLAADKGLYGDGGLAAVPGTSNHGWGLAVDVDIDSAAARTWLQANGHRFGFVEAVRREPWHWEYRPSQA